MSDIDPPSTLNILEEINKNLRLITFMADRIDKLYRMMKIMEGKLELIGNDCNKTYEFARDLVDFYDIYDEDENIKTTNQNQ